MALLIVGSDGQVQTVSLARLADHGAHRRLEVPRHPNARLVAGEVPGAQGNVHQHVTHSGGYHVGYRFHRHYLAAEG